MAPSLPAQPRRLCSLCLLLLAWRSQASGPLPNPKTLHEQHCCGAPKGHQVLLACDDGPRDAISDVHHAAYGGDLSPHDQSCGDERPPRGCVKDVAAAVRQRCLGRQTCVLAPEEFKDACGNSTGRLWVRWSCSHRSSHRPRTPLPKLPLRANGSVLLDSAGSRFRLVGVNWGGFHIKHAAGGLELSPLRTIARRVRELGFNVVRIPTSAEGVLGNPVVQDALVAANPRLKGRRMLEVLDEVVEALSDEGVLVWLDQHMLDSDWCCGNTDCNGLWFNERYSLDEWVRTLRTLAARYADKPAVVGIGLKNEPRSMCSGTYGDLKCNVSSFANVQYPAGDGGEALACAIPSWHEGPEHLQFRLAVERAGRAILGENPKLLLSVSGIDFSQFLNTVASHPLDLPKANVVFEAHEYAWYLDVSDKGAFRWEDNPAEAFANYTQRLDRNWGHLLRQDIAPVFVSEYGMNHKWTQSDERKWYELWSRYVQEEGPLAERGGLDWAYWQLEGVQQGGTTRQAGEVETYGVLNHCWTGPFEPEHYKAVQLLAQPPSRQRRLATGASRATASSSNSVLV